MRNNLALRGNRYPSLDIVAHMFWFEQGGYKLIARIVRLIARVLFAIAREFLSVLSVLVLYEIRALRKKYERARILTSDLNKVNSLRSIIRQIVFRCFNLRLGTNI